jgi:hypothetical protein
MSVVLTLNDTLTLYSNMLEYQVECIVDGLKFNSYIDISFMDGFLDMNEYERENSLRLLYNILKKLEIEDINLVYVDDDEYENDNSYSSNEFKLHDSEFWWNRKNNLLEKLCKKFD